MERQATHTNTEAACLLDQAKYGARFAAELARQIHHCVGTAEGHANQQLGALAIAGELAHFVRIVDHEGLHAVTQRVANVTVALDRVGVDAALGRAMPWALTSSTSPVVARSKKAPSSRRHATTAACGSGFSA